MIRDDVAVHNERAKLFAGFVNALAIAVIAVGVLAPVIAAMGRAPTPEGGPAISLSLALGCGLLGLALHGTAH
jgi:hypothetical protein